MSIENKKIREQSHWDAISLQLGIPVNELQAISLDELDMLVENHVGKLQYGHGTGGLIPRGNPLLGFGRLMDHSGLMKRFNHVFGR
jgi:hypothetical protein